MTPDEREPRTRSGQKAEYELCHFDRCAGLHGPVDCDCGVKAAILAIEDEARVGASAEATIPEGAGSRSPDLDKTLDADPEFRAALSGRSPEGTDLRAAHVDGVVRYMRSDTDKPKVCICCPGEPSHVFGYHIEVPEGTPRRSPSGYLDGSGGGWVFDNLRRLPEGTPVRLSLSARAALGAAPQPDLPCSRYFGSDGTLCATHNGRFLSDTETRCERNPLVGAAPVEPEPPRVMAALAELPPGPYEVEWPSEQGGTFRLWGRQGTAPDFTDGWAIPLVAYGVDTCMNALATILNGLRAAPVEDAHPEETT